MRKNGKTWGNMCSDLWNESVSDTFCQELGYFGASQTEYVEISNSTAQTYIYKDNGSLQKHSILFEVELSEKCENNKIVSIQCQEYGK